MTLTLRGSTVIQTPASLTEQKVKSMAVAQPQSNTYEQSAAVSSAAVKQQTVMRGHNVFRPDIYRVSDGTVV